MRSVCRPWVLTVVASLTSVAVHATIGRGLLKVDREPQRLKKTTVIRVIRKRSSPEKNEPIVPAPDPTSNPGKPHRVRKIAATPPASNQQANQPKEVKPVFGVSMDSTVSGANVGMNVQVGNTLAMAPRKTLLKPQQVKPIRAAVVVNKRMAAVPTYRLTAMPRPKTLVKAKYPEEARNAGIEGDTLLKLHIDEWGRVTRVELIKGIGHRLDQLAVSAAKRFVFEPAKVGNVAVPTVIPFTYQWEIEA